MKKYYYENIVSPSGDAVKATLERGPALDCVFHVHREYEITLVESSFGCRMIGDSLEHFSEGDLVLIGSMVPHHYLNSRLDSEGDDWSRLLVVQFAPDFCGRDLLQLPEADPIARMLDCASRGIRFPAPAAEKAAPLMRSLPELHGFDRTLRCLELLRILSLAPWRCINSSPAPELRRETPDERMNKILRFIRRRLDENRPPSLPECAKVACMTPPAFSGYFRRVAGIGFIDYITELRLNRAASLLTRSDRTVLEIAAESGFRSVSNFNRLFRARRGMPPTLYRKKYRVG